jgi:monoamine oxidase
MAATIFQLLDQRYGDRGDLLSRRRFLQRAGLAATVALARDSALLACPGAAVDRAIVIIGAGFAGLTAAYRLKKYGYKNVTVLEARPRVGGRALTLTDHVVGQYVEAGPEFTSPNHPTWMELKQELNLTFMDVVEDPGEAPIVLEGQRLTPRQTRALWEEMKKVKQRLNQDAEKIDAQQPWLPPNPGKVTPAQLIQWDRTSMAQWLGRQQGISKECRRALASDFVTINSVSLAWQSYLGFLAMVKGGGVEHYWTLTDTKRCVGGNQPVADKLANAFGRERIHLSTPVVAISDYLKGKKAKVRTATGRTYDADEVLLTVPPSTWNRIAFDPPLPAMLRVQMGNGIKFLAAVDGRFWQQDKQAGMGLSDGAVGWVWESTNNQKLKQEACLTVLSAGAAAETCRAWPVAERSANYVGELSVLFPNIARHYRRGRFLDWQREPWTKGTYSFPAPGEVTTVGPTLRKGLGKLLFAGEHTCYAFVGYMEGALNSGARLAKHLAQRDRVLRR